MSSKKAILWLKNDLRINDNPLFLYAEKNKIEIIPLFIWSPEEEKNWQLGSASKLWLEHSLKSLSKKLESLGSQLIIKSGPSKKILEEIKEKSSADEILHNQKPASLIFDLNSIKNKQGTPFKVFTPFYKHCLTLIDDILEQASNQELGKVKKLIPCKESFDSLRIEDLGLSKPSHAWQEKMLQHWNIGEEAAIKLVQSFKKRASDYSLNRDIPDIDGTSKLAPYLHFGEISPFRIWQEIPEESFRRQLVWREFAFYTMHYFPFTADENLKKEFDRFPWENNPEYLERWQKGLTGYPIVDAGMKELWETGWMHNRVRMIVGSFLIKDLLIHWKEGAKWFWDTLFDADLANNSMGWQWVAGSGVDASPFFRIFNPIKQGEKFDPEGTYVKHWLPELKNLSPDWIHKPFAAPPLILEAAGIRLGDNYPEPIVNHDAARKKALEGLQLTKLK